ncbi:MAG: hypothetical protein GC168_19845 [Candidatus Hydrogenedens sp.]|nr:hypothetical protein [Candidatus Hydrogenedens sp.]
MSRTIILLVAGLFFGTAVLPMPVHAQAPAQLQAPVASPAPAAAPKSESAPPPGFSMLQLGLAYSQSVVLGVLGGGILLGATVGGIPATLAGAVGGSLVGSWWFFDQLGEQFARTEQRR